jgi:hypothetical protein
MKVVIFPGDSVDIVACLQNLLNHGLILKYKVKDEVYGFIPKFLEHQYPHPHEAKSLIPEYNQCHDITLQMSLHVMKCPSDILNPDILNPDIPPRDASPKILASIPLTGKQGVYEITEEKLKDWESDFPGLDVMQALRDCKAWNVANPGKRKTRKGIETHIVRWLSKANDSGKNRRLLDYKPKEPDWRDDFLNGRDWAFLSDEEKKAWDELERQETEENERIEKEKEGGNKGKAQEAM